VGPGLRVAVVHTVGSVCRCGEAISEGLRMLGHEPVLVDSAQIEARAHELATRCHLVFDHTDTFEGRGLFRASVRMILEGRGARLVGSPGRACFLADDKVAAKTVMARAGVPTVPGSVISSIEPRVKSWLPPPWVVKPLFEHMSRGVGLVGSREELEAHLEALWAANPSHCFLIETLVPGRELAVPVLEQGGEPGVLPILEMRQASEESILDEGFKGLEFRGERQDVVQARLGRETQREIALMACRAFKALGLRDYARFDVRLSGDGTPFFLEANVTPSMEPFEAMAIAARLAGMDYPDLVARILDSALERYGKEELLQERRLRVELPGGTLSLVVPRGVHFPPESTLEMARMLDVRPGEEVLELGCGCGVLAMAAALAGADRVVATDLDPLALEATMANARQNGFEGRIEARAGSWFQVLDPVGEKEGFHVILATPPQTPSPRPMGPKYGGPDGLWHIKRIAASAPRFLKPKEGRLWLLAISLVNQEELFRLLDEHFEKVELAGSTLREFQPQEYESLDPGLFSYIQDLARAGKAWVGKSDSGSLAFRNLFIRASLPRKVT